MHKEHQPMGKVKSRGVLFVMEVTIVTGHACAWRPWQSLRQLLVAKCKIMHQRAMDDEIDVRISPS
jgi:hypothetical protein